MIKAILIDDEPLARSIVLEYLQSYPQVSVVEECGDGFQGLKAIQQHKPDLIFLDIQMPKINGFELLELVEEPPSIIFTTAFDEYAIQAFEKNAVDYLLKPFSKQRFDAAMKKVIDNPMAETKQVQAVIETAVSTQAPANRIVVKINGKIRIIPVVEIHYIEAADDYVKIITTEGSFLKNRTMSFFERSLDPAIFVRTHRSYIVNVQQITRIDPYEKDSQIALLRTGAKIPVSKSGYTRLKEVLGM